VAVAVALRLKKKGKKKHLDKRMVGQTDHESHMEILQQLEPE
jgi:hypothetical protein